jgi:hypothetical protein
VAFLPLPDIPVEETFEGEVCVAMVAILMNNAGEAG